MSSAADRSPPVRRRWRQEGFSLIETLIAVLVLSVGLLGMAALQMNAIKNNQLSLQRSQAVVMINFMLDSMRANRADAANGNYDTRSGASKGKTCTVPAAAANLVDNDRHFWLQALKDNIGNENTTCGEIDCQTNAGNTDCRVAIYWKDKNDSSAAEEKLEVATRL
jgi:type IV pilus assembly protein PilV